MDSDRRTVFQHFNNVFTGSTPPLFPSFLSLAPDSVTESRQSPLSRDRQLNKLYIWNETRLGIIVWKLVIIGRRVRARFLFFPNFCGFVMALRLLEMD